MSFKLRSLNLGKPEVYQTDQGKLESAYRKKPVQHPVYLTKLNFEGDEQADKKHHGGLDKAVCLYPAQHYHYWENEYGRSFSYPAFGENITVDGIEEKSVHIGDVFQLGMAKLQVSEPRKPCYIIARTHGIKDFPARVTKCGYTGFYLRVMEEGHVQVGDEMELIREDPSKVTIKQVNDVRYNDRNSRRKIERIVAVEALADGLRQSLENHLAKL
ncbi:MOSC domain-containing protein [Halobacillus salinarum]|uniref:MOSC domain-containing protein n=1 Tax=Halobacillus salinarum TaxID=2932257 RepID=A0ABY4EHB7_9BACI|nr:MOSC domain-containing protein [Halobacillus salinarum]UOQ43854.1 MOSC domain-containing protein [Halobacillus salinarum]